MNNKERGSYDQLSEDEKAEHDRGAPQKENVGDYETNVDIAHAMANAEKEDRGIIRQAKRTGMGQGFLSHREDEARAAAKKAGNKERLRLRQEEEQINEVIDLLQEKKDKGESEAEFALYVFDKDGQAEKAYTEYINRTSKTLSAPSICKIINLSIARRQQLAGLLSFGSFTGSKPSETSENEKIYFAKSESGYWREVCVDTEIEDNPENPDAIIFERYRVA